MVWVVNNVIFFPLSILFLEEKNMLQTENIYVRKMWRVVNSKLTAFFMNI